VDRANVGRTTFYLHYTGKDDLFLHCHDAILGQFQLSPNTHLSPAALLSPEPPEGMAQAYRHRSRPGASSHPSSRARTAC
jgi:AcrR family transcriptional regulator